MWVGCGVCVDGFNMDVLVRAHGCVSLHFPPFYFSCFLYCFVFVFFFFEICVSDFSSIFHDLNVHLFSFLSFSCFVILVVMFFMHAICFHDLGVFLCDGHCNCNQNCLITIAMAQIEKWNKTNLISCLV